MYMYISKIVHLYFLMSIKSNRALLNYRCMWGPITFCLVIETAGLLIQQSLHYSLSRPEELDTCIWHMKRRPELTCSCKCQWQSIEGIPLPFWDPFPRTPFILICNCIVCFCLFLFLLLLFCCCCGLFCVHACACLFVYFNCLCKNHKSNNKIKKSEFLFFPHAISYSLLLRRQAEHRSDEGGSETCSST